MSIAWASRPVSGEAAAERQDRADQRQQRGPQGTEGDREHDRGGDEADHFARAAALLLRGLLDPVAAQLHLESVAARVLGGGDQLVVGGLGDVGDRLLAVHVHGRERDPAVLGDLALCGALGERAVDPLDVREPRRSGPACVRSAPGWPGR